MHRWFNHRGQRDALARMLSMTVFWPRKMSFWNTKRSILRWILSKRRFCGTFPGIGNVFFTERRIGILVWTLVSCTWSYG